MKGYVAEKDGSAIFLTKDTQLDMALEKGCNIIKVEDNDTQTVIATPEQGFLEEHPLLEVTRATTNPFAEILATLEKGES